MSGRFSTITHLDIFGLFCSSIAFILCIFNMSFAVKLVKSWFSFAADLCFSISALTSESMYPPTSRSGLLCSISFQVSSHILYKTQVLGKAETEREAETACCNITADHMNIHSLQTNSTTPLSLGQLSAFPCTSCRWKSSPPRCSKCETIDFLQGI